MGPGIFSHFLESEFLEIESRRQHKASFAEQDLDELAELEVIEPAILLAPQCRNGGWPDLDVAIVFHCEMNTEERIPQIGHRIDVRVKCIRGLVGVEIKPLERKDAISFRENEIERNLVSMESRRVDNMARRKGFLALLRRSLSFARKIGRPGMNDYALPLTAL